MDSRALAGAAAALGLAAGIGLGYALFHSDGTKTPASAAPAATTTAASPAGAADFTLGGKLTLKWSTGAFERNEAGLCAGSGGYADITGGAAVTITDQAGTVIATGQLGNGSADVDTSTGTPIACAFSFSVPHVPDGKTFYGVQVSHRGAVQFSTDKAKYGDVALSIGG